MDSLVRGFKALTFHRRHVVKDLTVAMLFMKLNNNQRGLETFFFKDPMGISEDIRLAGLGALLGTYVTRRLISGLFTRMGDREGLHGSVAAANLLVGLVRRSDKSRFLQGATQHSREVNEQYDFLADVPDASSRIRPNARRLGIVYGALVALAADVQSKNVKNDRMLEIAIRGSSAVLSAAAEIAMRMVTPIGSTVLPDAIKVVSELLVEGVEKSRRKSTVYTNHLIRTVTVIFQQIIDQNRAARCIPGYYGHPNDRDLVDYEKEGQAIFTAVSRTLLADDLEAQQSGEQTEQPYKQSRMPLLKLVPAIAKASAGQMKGDRSGVVGDSA